MAVRLSVQYSPYMTVSVAPKCVQVTAFDAFEADPERHIVIKEM